MKQNCILLTVLLSLLGSQNSMGQSIGPCTLNATGGTGTAGGYTIDWSIGEMTMVSTFPATPTLPSSSAVIVTQGVLQPVTGPWVGITNINLTNNLKVFPNPASSIINLQYTSAKTGTLSYTLMDMAGSIIVSQKTEVTQNVTLAQLSIPDIAAGSYLLEVVFNADDATKETAAYKIEKLK